MYTACHKLHQSMIMGGGDGGCKDFVHGIAGGVGWAALSIQETSHFHTQHSLKPIEEEIKVLHVLAKGEYPV